MASTYNFSQEFQDRILACCLRYPEKFDIQTELIQPQYFNGTVAVDTVFRLREFYKKYERLPDFIELANFAVHKLAKVSSDRAREVFEYIVSLEHVDTSGHEFVFDMVANFARERAIFRAIKLVHTAQTEGKEVEGGIIPLFESALAVGSTASDMGLLLDQDYLKIVEQSSSHESGTRTGFMPFDNLWKRGWMPGWLVVPLAPPKRYKCLGRGTKVLMYDGTTKSVEDIRVGDQVMGDDSTPRNVLECGSGQGPLYRVDQDAGDSFVCNDAHILCLKHHDGRTTEISAEDYANQSDKFKRQWLAYKNPVEFSAPEQLNVNPYFFGLRMGRGEKTPCDGRKGDTKSELLGLTASRANRLAILAGIIDSAGRLSRMHGYAVDLSSLDIARYVARLAGSLGFLVRVSSNRTRSKTRTWRVDIDGDLSAVPVKTVSHKDACRWLRYSGRYNLKVTPIGRGEYWGITIDGNRRFMLGDFTVTHNTTWCLNLALNMIHQNIGVDIIYYACEISQELAGMRALCSMTGCTQDELYENRDGFVAGIEAQIPMYTGRLLFKSYPAGAITIPELKAHAKKAIQTYGLKPKAIFIDYADTVRSDLPENTPEPKKQASIYTAARKLGHDLGAIVIMPDRCKVEFVDKPVPNMKAFQGAFEKAGIVDISFGLCQTEMERQAERIRYFVFLNRHGREGVLMEGKTDIPRYCMTVDAEIEYDPEMAEIEEAHKQTKRYGGGKPKKLEQLQDDDLGKSVPMSPTNE